MRPFATPFALFMWLMCSATAGAFDLNLKATAGIDVEAGLDAATRDFLQKLPENIRKEIVTAVRQSLDIADVHVASYLAQLDALLTKQINDVACKSATATELITSTIAERIFNSRNTPVQDLRNDFEAIRDSFRRRDNPEVYRLRYADLYARSVVTYCRVALAIPAQEEVIRIQSEIRPLWNAWKRLDGQCSEARDCLAWLRNSTANAIASANEWDVFHVHASERLQAIGDVPSPAFWQSYSSQDYEDEFVNMLAVQDEINVAKSLREASARQDIEDARELVANATAQLRMARRHLATLSLPEQRAAVSSANKVSKDSEAIQGTLNNAVQTWSEMTVDARDIAARFATVRNGAQSVKRVAQNNIAALRFVPFRLPF
ncbi:hypothetical protein ACCS54_18920 [Rhizobium johnstonii]|uniref:hypothetical protein n=1 Tax=Rhizobium johnstonii TaxID=3019933 RepID=UPI003F962BF5